MSRPLDDNSIRAKAKEWGLNLKSTHRILTSGLSIAGKEIMIEQARRCAANRQQHMRNGDYRKRRPHDPVSSV